MAILCWFCLCFQDKHIPSKHSWKDVCLKVQQNWLIRQVKYSLVKLYMHLKVGELAIIEICLLQKIISAAFNWPRHTHHHLGQTKWLRTEGEWKKIEYRRYKTETKMEDSNPPVQNKESQQNVVTTSKPAFSQSLHSQLSCPAPQGPERGGSPCGPSPNGSPLVGRSRKKYSYPAVSPIGGGFGVQGSSHLNLPASHHQYVRHGRQVMVSSHFRM